MKFYMDTEFIEGTQKRIIGNTKPTIDLISIGIVSEGTEKTLMKPYDVYNEAVTYSREYYAISKDFNIKEAWNRYDLKLDIKEGGTKKVYWLRENVLKPIFDEWNTYSYHKFNYKNMKYCIQMIGKTNKQIAEEIKHFVANRPINSNKEQWILDYDTKDIKFYGYYCAYDWVVFCWLFGKMIDLPKGFPMYCIDVKQMMDIIADVKYAHLRDDLDSRKGIVGSEFTLKRKLDIMKGCNNYPKQTNEHHALSDAKWIKALHDFLQQIK